MKHFNIYDRIVVRAEFLESAYYYFNAQITDSMAPYFWQLALEGKKLCKDFSNIESQEYCDNLKEWLRRAEMIFEAAGKNNPSEICDIKDVLPNLILQSEYIIRLLSDCGL